MNGIILLLAIPMSMSRAGAIPPFDLPLGNIYGNNPGA